ncbi:MAG: DUF488 domain-containing protein [Acidobacteriota bacterium]|jgi:uncharacterized protein (DUF488 family)|nr:DUF488 domain-containing protein [Acidobacteriota bacterium]
MSAPDLVLHTVGHSNRSAREFLDLLHAHAIVAVADVRSLPRSRRNPHFNSEALADTLGEAGILYSGMPALGGLRRPRPGSRHLGLPEGGFRAYADYMETPAFESALDVLMAFALRRRSAILCAEADYRNCHRSLLSDALQQRKVEILHITGIDQLEQHQRTGCARVLAGRLAYPAEQGSLF